MAEANRLLMISLAISIITVILIAASFLSLSSRIADLNERLTQIEDRISGIEDALEGLPATTPTPEATPVAEVEEAITLVRLTVIGPWSGVEQEYFLKVIEEYQRANPGVEIRYVPMRPEDVARTAAIQFEAGIAPADVIITPWAWWIVEMARKGHVVDVTDLVNRDEYVPGIVENVEYDGKIWGVPFTMWLKPGFWYKKSFFEENGLEEPETWEEFVALLETISGIDGITAPIVSGNGVGWPLSDVAEHFIITFAGAEAQLGLISGERSFTDPDVREAMERLVSLIEAGYFGEPIEWTAGVEKWWNEEYALYFMGTWITGMVEDPNDLGFFTLPGAKGVVGGADYAFIPKYAENVEEAMRFLEYLATEGQAVHVSTPAGKVPTWLGVGIDQLWPPMQVVFQKIKEQGLSILPDLDDSIGGDWQTLFWDQLKLLWVQPDRLGEVLATLTEQHPVAG